MKRTVALGLCCVTVILFQPLCTTAFETSTHRLINRQAASALVLSDSGQTFDDFLRYQLLLPGGLDESLNGQTVLGWLGTGGVAEDQYMPEVLGQKLAEYAGGVTRSPRHFHTPLKDWEHSGLNLGGFQFESSVRWAQLPDQGFTGKAAWGDARSTYFEALTNSDPDERARLFGDTFKILGQLMHLVADLGSVAHTRNAQHLLGDPFEEFVNEPINQSLIAGYQGMDPSYVRFTPTNDAVATVPVARLWDTDTYNGSNPDVTAQLPGTPATVGLAEFTSANFFSRSTIAKIAGADPVLPYPAIDQLEPNLTPGPTGTQRQYLKKTGQGITIDHMVLESAFNLFEPSTWQRFSLDDKVFQDYAVELLPRAIGYSAGLIDYFFRGQLGAFEVSGGVPESCQPARIVCLDVWNSTEGEETDGAGEVTLLVLCCWPTLDTFYVSAPVPITLTRERQMVSFTLNSVPPPGNGADYVFGGTYIIYRGPLGKEEGAVMFGGSICPVIFQTQWDFSYVNCFN